MAINNLSKKIDTEDINTRDLLIKWNTVINKLLVENVVNEVTITGVEAEKYRYDMEGLLLYLEVDHKFIYPHIRVNGYNTSVEYTGDLMVIKIIDNRALYSYYEKFIKL